MSMTRDTYAKEVIKAAEAAFHRNEAVSCPHEGCGERLGVVQQNIYSTRSLFCPVHGRIFQEQTLETFSKLDWEGAEQRLAEKLSEEDENEDSMEDEESYN